MHADGYTMKKDHITDEGCANNNNNQAQAIFRIIIIIIIVIFTMKDDRKDAGQGLMHTDGYTMTRITNEGCANYNPTQAIVTIMFVWTTTMGCYRIFFEQYGCVRTRSCLIFS